MKTKKQIIQEIKKSELKQKLIHEHYFSDGHEGFANWCVTLIDQFENKKRGKKERTVLDKQVEYLESSWA